MGERTFSLTTRVVRKLQRDLRGGLLPMAALGVVLAIGITAMAFDLGQARVLQQSLNLGADAAALAAAARMPDLDAARATAIEYAGKNMPPVKYGQVLRPEDVEFGYWDPKTRAFSTGDNPVDGRTPAVRVTAHLNSVNNTALGTFFSRIFGIDSLDVTGSAVAGRTGAPCVLVLESSGTSTQLGWNSDFQASGCGVQVNSTSSRALIVDNEASLDAADICVGGAARVSGTATPTPREYCPGEPDPLAGVEPPGYGGCDHNGAVYRDSNVTLLPGVYCGGLMIEGDSDVTLSPGLYVIKDGAWAVLGNASVSGSGVTIFLKGTKGKINFNDTSSVNITAPTTGPLQGLLIFQDRNSSSSHSWNGRSTSLVGVIYLPSGDLTANSNHLITPYRSCTVIIANTLKLNSGAGVSIDLTGPTCRSMLPAAYRRGVVLLD